MAAPLVTFARSLASWASAVLVVSLVVAACYYFVRADEELRRHIQTILNRQYPHHEITITSAHLAPGENVRVRGLSIARPTIPGLKDRSELLFCDEAVVHCNLTMATLLSGDVDISRVELRNMTLNPVRESDGTWNFQDLIPKHVTGKPIPTISIQDANVELIDRISSSPSVLILSDLNATLSPNVGDGSETRIADPGRIAIRASFSNDHLRGVMVQGWVDPKTLAWSLQGNVSRFDIAPDLLRTMHASIGPAVERLSDLRAHGQLRFGAEQGTNEGQPRFRVEGSLEEGRFEGGVLPAPVTDIHVPKFECDNHSWRVDGATASYGTAVLEISAHGQKLSTDEIVTVTGDVRQLNVTHELIASLPASIQAIWQRYRPLGLIDGTLQGVRKEGQWWLASDIHCRDVTLLCDKFPYPLVRAEGRVQFRQHESLTVDLWASADHASERTPIHIVADISRPGPDYFGKLVVQTEGWLALDPRMTDALKPQVRKVLGDLDAHGEIMVQASFDRPDGALEAMRDIVIDVRDGSVQYERFPYPFTRVRGRVHMRNDAVSFEQFVGHNDSGVVQCQGTWRAATIPDTSHMFPGVASGDLAAADSDHALHLEFTATNIPCDTELRQALPDGPGQVWKNLRPTGTIDHARIDLDYQTGMSEPQIHVHVTQLPRLDDPERRSLEIQPTWFPLRMNRVTGSFVYQSSDGTFAMENIRAEHGSSQRSFTLQAQGGGAFRSDGTWIADLRRILADGVDVTPEVLEALPRPLRNGLTAMNFQGKLSFDGNMRFEGDSRTNSTVRSSWQAETNVDDGALQLAGHRVDSLYGAISLAGESGETGSVSQGRARFDSLMCNGIQVSHVKTPWQMDATQLLFGTWASTTSEKEHLQASLFGGTLRANGAVSFDTDNAFQLQSWLTNFDATDVARDLAMPSRISGRGDAWLQLVGNAQGAHTLDGKGGMRLREANLAKLPAIVTLLNELGTRSATPDVFSSSDIEFTVQGPYLNLQRFDLHGESLSLKGQGWISFSRQMEIAFYSIWGGESRYHTLARPWVGQASQRFLRILVSGSIDNAQWTREVLPGLTETIQQLFPELSRSTDRSRALFRR